MNGAGESIPIRPVELRIDLLVQPHMTCRKQPRRLFLRECPKKFRPGLRSSLVAPQSLWAHGSPRRPLCGAGWIAAFPLRHDRAGASPPSDVEIILRETAGSSNPIRVARRHVRDDGYNSEKVPCSWHLCSRRLLIGIFRSTKGFDPLPDVFGTGAVAENGFAPFLWRKSVVFSAQKIYGN